MIDCWRHVSIIFPSIGETDASCGESVASSERNQELSECDDPPGDPQNAEYSFSRKCTLCAKINHLRDRATFFRSPECGSASTSSLVRVKMTRCEHLQPTHNRQHHPMSIAIMDHTMPTGQPAGDRDSWRGRDPRDKLMINLMILLAGNMESRALSEKARRVLYLTTDSIG